MSRSAPRAGNFPFHQLANEPRVGDAAPPCPLLDSIQQGFGHAHVDPIGLFLDLEAHRHHFGKVVLGEISFTTKRSASSSVFKTGHFFFIVCYLFPMHVAGADRTQLPAPDREDGEDVPACRGLPDRPVPLLGAERIVDDNSRSPAAPLRSLRWKGRASGTSPGSLRPNRMPQAHSASYDGASSYVHCQESGGPTPLHCKNLTDGWPARRHSMRQGRAARGAGALGVAVGHPPRPG